MTRGGGPMISMDEVEVVKGSPPAGLDAITTRGDIAGQLGRIMDGLESVWG